MTTVVVNTDDTAMPLGCVLPCQIAQGKEPMKQPMTDKDTVARCRRTTAVERSLDKVTVPPRSASATPLTREERNSNKPTRSDDQWMYIHCPGCNTDFPKVDHPSLVCPKCRNTERLMLHGRYNWDSPVVSSDDQATDNANKRLKAVPEELPTQATGLAGRRSSSQPPPDKMKANEVRFEPGSPPTLLSAQGQWLRHRQNCAYARPRHW